MYFVGAENIFIGKNRTDAPGKAFKKLAEKLMKPECVGAHLRQTKLFTKLKKLSPL